MKPLGGVTRENLVSTWTRLIILVHQHQRFHRTPKNDSRFYKKSQALFRISLLLTLPRQGDEGRLNMTLLNKNPIEIGIILWEVLAAGVAEEDPDRHLAGRLLHPSLVLVVLLLRLL